MEEWKLNIDIINLTWSMTVYNKRIQYHENIPSARGCRGNDRMVVDFHLLVQSMPITSSVFKLLSHSWQDIPNTTLSDQVFFFFSSLASDCYEAHQFIGCKNGLKIQKWFYLTGEHSFRIQKLWRYTIFKIQRRIEHNEKSTTRTCTVCVLKRLVVCI